MLSLSLKSLPRIKTEPLAITHQLFHDKYSCVPPGSKSKSRVVIRGRLANKRWSGKNLAFYDVCNNGFKIQSVYTEVTPELEEFMKSLRKGDHVEVNGIAGRTAAGELSIYANKTIRISQCKHRLPEVYNDPEKRRRNRHIDFLVNPKSANVIRIRSLVISTLRTYLYSKSFMELETPILQSAASGANARPFTTKSILGPAMQLRISPELALKKAVVGGFERVFEIGKCFRNEGLSRRHQPEFTTCEFYEAYANINDLITTTKKLLVHLETIIRKDQRFTHTEPLYFAMDRFKEVDFMEQLAVELEGPVPMTQEDLISLFKARNLDIPKDDSLPNLYDTLCDIFLKKHIGTGATFLINFPASMSPLSKSTNGVAHRFEFYVKGMELINAYEEENDPVVQRQKFLSSRTPTPSGEAVLTAEEEEYCNVLEYGLPATGGWGLGIDRLIMVLTGSSSIQDVLLSGGFNVQAMPAKSSKKSSLASPESSRAPSTTDTTPSSRL